MSTYNDVKTELKTARLARDARTVTLLSTLLGEMDLRAKVEPSVGLKLVDDEAAQSVVKKFIKNLDELTQTDEVEAERNLYTKFLPTQLDEGALRSILAEYARPGKTLGEAMAFLKANYAGRYDGKMASTIVKSLISA